MRKKYYLNIIILLILVIGLPAVAWANPSLVDSFEESSALLNGWEAVLGLVDIFAFLGLIFIAFANILQIDIETFDIKRLLPSLIVGVIAANFSLFFCKEIIRFSAAFFDYFSVPRGLGEALAEIFATFGLTMGGLTLGTFIGTLGFGASLSILTLVIGVLLILLPMVPLFLIMIMLWIRMFILWFLVIISPLAFLFYFMPFGSDLAKQWFSWFLKWTFLGPIAYFFVWLLVQIHEGGYSVADEGGLTMFIATVALLSAAVYVPFILNSQVLGWLTGKISEAAVRGWESKAGQAARSWTYDKARQTKGIGSLIESAEGTDALITQVEEDRKERIKQTSSRLSDLKLAAEVGDTYNGDHKAIKEAASMGDATALRYKDKMNSLGPMMAENMTAEDLEGMIRGSFDNNEERMEAFKKAAAEGNLDKAEDLMKADGAIMALTNKAANPQKYGEEESEKARQLLEGLNITEPTDTSPEKLAAPFYDPPANVSTSEVDPPTTAQAVHEDITNNFNADLTQFNEFQNFLDDLEDRIDPSQEETPMDVRTDIENRNEISLPADNYRNPSDALNMIEQYRRGAQAGERYVSRTGNSPQNLDVSDLTAEIRVDQNINNSINEIANTVQRAGVSSQGMQRVLGDTPRRDLPDPDKQLRQQLINQAEDIIRKQADATDSQVAQRLAENRGDRREAIKDIFQEVGNQNPRNVDEFKEYLAETIQQKINQN